MLFVWLIDEILRLSMVDLAECEKDLFGDQIYVISYGYLID